MASVLITGASGGLGLELAKQLLELPASSVGKVFAMSRSTSSAPFQSLIDAHGDRFEQVVGSVTDDKSVEEAFKTAEKALGSKGLDILVNNAATFARHEGGTVAMKPDDLAEVLMVNVVGVHRATAAAMPLLRKGNLKRVINM
jgi:NAD(P)-dependent dehydrogenase (short-subunit alcohol dehydrogenase family)